MPRGKQLTETQKVEIREKLAEDDRMSLGEIARLCGVGKTTVHRIAQEEAAKHQRCPGCGHLSELDESGKCLKCRVDAAS